MLLSKYSTEYSTKSLDMKVGKIKNLMWRQLVDIAYTKENLNFY